MPKAVVNAGSWMPVTVEELAYRVSEALVKVVQNKEALGPDGQTVEELREQWPTAGPGVGRGLGRYRFEASFVSNDESQGELTLSIDGETLETMSVDALVGKLIATFPSTQRLCVGYDQGVPVCDAYAPPFYWQGVIHEVAVDTPGTAPTHHEEAEAMLRADRIPRAW